jgi:hypothetical protein
VCAAADQNLAIDVGYEQPPPPASSEDRGGKQRVTNGAQE